MKTMLDNQNLVLAILTALYVILTFRILRVSTKALKTNLMPLLFPRVSFKDKKLIFYLENLSSFPAFNIDLWIIGTFNQEEYPYEKILSDEYRKSVKINFNKTLYNYESEFYGILDRAIYYEFPPKSKIEFELSFGNVPTTINLIMQFQDSLGNNFVYQTWLYEDGDRMRQGFLKYIPLKKCSRIDYLLWENSIPALINKLKSRFILDKELRDILIRTIPAGYQKISSRKYFGIEDKGILTKVQ
jgi:hypothetical protein